MPASFLVIEGSIAFSVLDNMNQYLFRLGFFRRDLDGHYFLRRAFEFPEKVVNKLRRRQVVYQDDLRCVEEIQTLLHSSVGFT